MAMMRLNNFSQSTSANYTNKSTSQETLFNYQLNCQVSVNKTFLKISLYDIKIMFNLMDYAPYFCDIILSWTISLFHNS